MAAENVIFTFDLSKGDPYDLLLIKTLSAQPTDLERKHLLVNAVLYYLRSPAFQLIDKIEVLSKQLGRGLTVTGTSSVATFAPNLRMANKEAVDPDRIEAPSGDLVDDGMDDAFASMVNSVFG